MPPNTRERMVEITMEELRRHGYHGTGFRKVVAESGGSRGSMYHYFPGGKAQLAAEAVALAGSLIEQLIQSKLETDDVVTGIEGVWSWWIGHVEQSELAGCPVLAVAVESHSEPELAAAAATAFDSWIAAFRRGLERAGMKSDDAQGFALLILSSLEGATGIARAHGDLKLLELAGRRVAATLRAELAQLSPK